ncbi:MAG: hypothetical protein RLZZ385_2622 [Pseudomonadota bacterium]|jgi:pyridoxal phosphate enzyme (YggS family)
MPSITENIRRTVNHIHELEARYHRPQGAVTLLAVSKQQPASAIREAAAAGLRDFGENYLQEALDKQLLLRDCPLCWHFIGPIQSNKTRLIAAHFHWVHSVDRLKIAQRLSEQRDPALPPLNVCVQVNISGEDSKSGVAPAETRALCMAVAALPHLRLRGLMTIPAPMDTVAEQRRCFGQLAALQREIAIDLPQLDCLSMGMSGDYEAAIAEGSTLVRIGTALFGARI